MNLFYNFELDDDLTDSYFSLEMKKYLKELKSFCKTRYKVLEDEINQEEYLGHKMIVLIIPFNEGDFNGIAYEGYSKKLIKKLKDCISAEDMKYLQKRFSTLF